MTVEAFFAYARERHNIYLRRERTSSPWTNDPILQQYRFTNVFRELDKTTDWFRRNVRDKLRDDPEVLLATVLFRWFNRISTGEAIFCHPDLTDRTGWERRGRLDAKGEARGWCAELRAMIRAYCGDGPYVTGSYIIKGTDGMDKLEGVLDAFYKFLTTPQATNIVSCKVQAHWSSVAGECLHRRSRNPVSLFELWDWLRRFDYLGPFTAYEVVSDLRYTALLDRAPDIMTWANPGPGAARGLARIHGRFQSKEGRPSRLARDCTVSNEQMQKEMQQLLDLSRRVEYWPQGLDWGDYEIYQWGAWPAWEMREVEHTLCEFDKYTRAKLGQGRPRQIFRSAA